MLAFSAEKHLYESLPGQPQIDWVSGTSLLSHFKKPFPADGALKASKNRKGKWFKMDPKLIQLIWDQEKLRASEDGTAVHDQSERNLIECGVTTRDGKVIPVIAPLTENWTLTNIGTGEAALHSRKLAPEQRLQEGCYPEHFLYLKSVGVCGQADIVEVVGDKLHVDDYKTYKELKTKGYESYDGQTAKMLHCLSHLDDCNLNHAALQMSLYAYIILKHNPQLKIGTLTLRHLVLKPATVLNTITGLLEAMTDDYGYPIYVRDEQGVPLIERVDVHEVPYRKKEVEDMLRWLAANRHKLPAKTH